VSRLAQAGAYLRDFRVAGTANAAKPPIGRPDSFAEAETPGFGDRQRVPPNGGDRL